ncbi:MAG TPA: acylphosphatase [Bacteroidales bacterium]|nr:acylphosphatase [Bacteroidales bacterium]
MNIHLNITVSGRVQKIGFRYSTLDVATQLGIHGFVRNLPNGNVYIEAEGREEDVRAFAAWCRQGPPWARVDDIEVEKSEIKGYPDFTIKRD